jgi:chromosome segregation ATPase
VRQPDAPKVLGFQLLLFDNPLVPGLDVTEEAIEVTAQPPAEGTDFYARQVQEMRRALAATHGELSARHARYSQISAERERQLAELAARLADLRRYADYLSGQREAAEEELLDAEERAEDYRARLCEVLHDAAQQRAAAEAELALARQADAVRREAAAAQYRADFAAVSSSLRAEHDARVAAEERAGELAARLAEAAERADAVDRQLAEMVCAAAHLERRGDELRIALAQRDQELLDAVRAAEAVRAEQESELARTAAALAAATGRNEALEAAIAKLTADFDAERAAEAQRWAQVVGVLNMLREGRQLRARPRPS